MTRLLMHVEGSIGARFLSQRMDDALLRAPAPSLMHPNGSWLFLGWDVTRVGSDGGRYSKNGGSDATATLLEHAVPDIDRAVFLNEGGAGKEEDGGPHKAVVEAPRDEIVQQHEWPNADGWSRSPSR